MESLSLEVEAIWGSVVKENLKPLYKCASTLSVNIDSYLRNTNDLTRDCDPNDMRIEQNTYRFPGEPENDLFLSEIIDAVNKIENFIKPHLKI